MKTLITSQGNDLNAKIDERFGRCQYFAIYSPQNNETIFVENPYKNQDHAAGVKVAEYVIENNISKIITGMLGPKAEMVLKGEDISYKSFKEKTIAEIIELL